MPIEEYILERNSVEFLIERSQGLFDIGNNNIGNNIEIVVDPNDIKAYKFFYGHSECIVKIIGICYKGCGISETLNLEEYNLRGKPKFIVIHKEI